MTLLRHTLLWDTPLQDTGLIRDNLQWVLRGTSCGINSVLEV